MNRYHTVLFRILIFVAMLFALFGPAQVALAGTCTSTGSGGNWTAAANWTGCTVTDGIGPITGDAVVIVSGSPITVNVSSVASKLTIDSGATLTLGADLTIDGTSGDVMVLNNGINLGTHTLTLNGNGSYSIKVNAPITITGSSGGVFLITNTIASNKTVTVLTDFSGTLTIDNNVKLEISNPNLPSWQTVGFDPGDGLTIINGTLQIDYGGIIVSHGPASYGNSSTLLYNTLGGNEYQPGPEWPYGSGSNSPWNVKLTSAATTVTFPNNSFLTARGNVTLESNTNLNLSNRCISKPPEGECGLDIKGNWYNNGGNLATNFQYVVFNGPSFQTIGGSAATSFDFLATENTSGVGLDHAITVNYLLAVLSGLFNLNQFNITILSYGRIVVPSPSSTNMIVADDGRLCKTFNTFGTVDQWFYIGDDLGTVEYSPVYLHLPFDNYIGYTICIRVENVKHPNIGSSVSDYIDRYWTITRTSGLPDSSTFQAEFYYVAADIHGTESNLYDARFVPGTTDSPHWEWTDTKVNLPPPPHAMYYPSVSMLSEADYTPLPKGPTAVNIVDMQAVPSVGQVFVKWTTAQEVDLAGFKVYRSASANGSNRTQISGFIAGQAAGSTTGSSYKFADTTVQKGIPYYYWIESVESGGSTELFGPFQATLEYTVLLPLAVR